MKLRKMKGKGQVGDPYLAEFTQRVIDQRKGNKEMLDMEKQEAEEVGVITDPMCSDQ